MTRIYVVLFLSAFGLLGCSLDEPAEPPCKDQNQTFCDGVCLVLSEVNASFCKNDVLSCKSDYANCDGDSSNGCEQSIIDDPNNCGSCGSKCESNEFCNIDKCESKCGDKCLDFQKCSDDGECVNESCIEDMAICSDEAVCKIDGKCYTKAGDVLELCSNDDVINFITNGVSLQLIQSVYDMPHASASCAGFHLLIDYYKTSGSEICSQSKGCLDPIDMIHCVPDVLSQAKVNDEIDVNMPLIVFMSQLDIGPCGTNSCVMNEMACSLDNECDMGYCKTNGEYKICNDLYDSAYERRVDRIIDILNASDDEICTKYLELVSELKKKCVANSGDNCLVDEDPVILCGESFLKKYQQTDKGKKVVTDEMIEKFKQINVSCWED